MFFGYIISGASFVLALGIIVDGAVGIKDGDGEFRASARMALTIVGAVAALFMAFMKP